MENIDLSDGADEELELVNDPRNQHQDIAADSDYYEDDDVDY